MHYSDRCIIYLVLAIGLTFDSGLAEGALQVTNLKEQFFASAEALLQSIETQRGIETYNGVPWTLQALVLMSLYMLCVSRRHAAHSYCGETHISFACRKVRLIIMQVELSKLLSRSGFIEGKRLRARDYLIPKHGSY